MDRSNEEKELGNAEFKAARCRPPPSFFLTGCSQQTCPHTPQQVIYL